MFECVSFEIFQPKGVKCIMLCYAMPSSCEILQSLTTFNLLKLQNYPEQKTKSKPVKQRSASAVRLSFACVAGLEVRRHPPGFHASLIFMKCFCRTFQNEFSKCSLRRCMAKRKDGDRKDAKDGKAKGESKDSSPNLAPNLAPNVAPNLAPKSFANPLMFFVVFPHCWCLSRKGQEVKVRCGGSQGAQKYQPQLNKGPRVRMCSECEEPQCELHTHTHLCEKRLKGTDLLSVNTASQCEIKVNRTTAKYCQCEFLWPFQHQVQSLVQQRYHVIPFTFWEDLGYRWSVGPFQAFFEEHGIKVAIPEGKDVDITPLAGFQFDGFAKRLIKWSPRSHGMATEHLQLPQGHKYQQNTQIYYMTDT